MKVIFAIKKNCPQLNIDESTICRSCMTSNITILSFYKYIMETISPHVFIVPKLSKQVNLL